MSQPKFSVPRLEKRYLQYLPAIFILCFLWEGGIAPLAFPYAGSVNKTQSDALRRAVDALRDTQDPDETNREQLVKQNNELAGIGERIYSIARDIANQRDKGWTELRTVQGRLLFYLGAVFVLYGLVPVAFMFVRGFGWFPGPWATPIRTLRVALRKEGWVTEEPGAFIDLNPAGSHYVDEEKATLIYAHRDQERIAILVCLMEGEQSPLLLAERIGYYATLQTLLANSKEPRPLFMAVPAGLRETLLAEESSRDAFRQHVSTALFYDSHREAITGWQAPIPLCAVDPSVIRD